MQGRSAATSRHHARRGQLRAVVPGRRPAEASDSSGAPFDGGHGVEMPTFTTLPPARRCAINRNGSRGEVKNQAYRPIPLGRTRTSRTSPRVQNRAGAGRLMAQIRPAWGIRLRWIKGTAAFRFAARVCAVLYVRYLLDDLSGGSQHRSPCRRLPRSYSLAHTPACHEGAISRHPYVTVQIRRGDRSRQPLRQIDCQNTNKIVTITMPMQAASAAFRTSMRSALARPTVLGES